MISHCVAFLKNRAYDKAYKTYITDALKIISENTAHAVGQGKYMTLRYADIVSDEKPEERTEEEIINSIKDKLRKNK